MAGVLYVVATPIGNLRDISERALEVLRSVALIACEDTRQSRKLLDAYGIHTRLLALHQHNERSAAEQVLQYLQGGQDIALISDAGTPLVSDPGAWLTQAAHTAGLRVVPIPGASSVMAALSASGLSADRFSFAGFVPSRDGERQRFLRSFLQSEETVVMFETPHRIADTLAAVNALFPAERELVVARELTKTFEQIVRLTAGSACDWLAESADHGKGEFVLLLAGAKNQALSGDWQEMADTLQDGGMSNRDAAAFVARFTSAAKKTVYQYLLDRGR